MENIWSEVSRKCLIKASEIAGKNAIVASDAEDIGRLVDVAITIYQHLDVAPQYGTVVENPGWD